MPFDAIYSTFSPSLFLPSVCLANPHNIQTVLQKSFPQRSKFGGYQKNARSCLLASGVKRTKREVKALQSCHSLLCLSRSLHTHHMCVLSCACTCSLAWLTSFLDVAALVSAALHSTFLFSPFFAPMYPDWVDLLVHHLNANSSPSSSGLLTGRRHLRSRSSIRWRRDPL